MNDGSLKESDEATRNEMEEWFVELMTETIQYLNPGGIASRDDEQHELDGSTELPQFTLEQIQKCGTKLRGITQSYPTTHDALTLTKDVYEIQGQGQNGDSVMNETLPQWHLVSKEELMELSLVGTYRNVASHDELSLADINANGTPESIDAFGKIAFRDPDTKELDTHQKRAFEIIMSNFLLTFHKDAAAKDKLHEIAKVGDQERSQRR